MAISKLLMSREIKAPEVIFESAKSFDGQHELQFNEKSHRYKWMCECHAKKSATGVTTFLKASMPTSIGLIRWMQGQALEYFYKNLSYPIDLEQKDRLMKEAKTAHEAVAQEAADIGTICHAYAELHSLGNTVDAMNLLDKVRQTEKFPIIQECVGKYLKWAFQNEGSLIKAEGLIASPTYLYCGKFDRLDKVNGRIRLRDYKTSKSIYVDQFIQLASYAMALKEWNNIDVEELEVLRFGKDDGAFETLVIDNKDEIQVFKDQAIRCRQTFDFLKLNNDPRFDWKKK